MKVKELIQILHQLPDDLEIFIGDEINGVRQLTDKEIIKGSVHSPNKRSGENHTYFEFQADDLIKQWREEFSRKEYSTDLYDSLEESLESLERIEEKVRKGKRALLIETDDAY